MYAAILLSIIHASLLMPGIDDLAQRVELHGTRLRFTRTHVHSYAVAEVWASNLFV